MNVFSVWYGNFTFASASFPGYMDEEEGVSTGN
jgi:hypothetical protein